MACSVTAMLCPKANPAWGSTDCLNSVKAAIVIAKVINGTTRSNRRATGQAIAVGNPNRAIRPAAHSAATPAANVTIVAV